MMYFKKLPLGVSMIIYKTNDVYMIFINSNYNLLY